MATFNPDHTVVVQLAPGEILDGRWRIDAPLGQGAMGSVFTGQDLKIKRRIAIKVLSPEHAHRKKLVARFEREVAMMGALSHPNIVTFYGHGRWGALPYLVMEYLPGLTLTEVLKKKGAALSIAETLSVLKPLSQGLHFLHSNNVTHRDVKPQNVMITTEGRVTILDFGVVRDQANPGLTKPGAMVGTPFYMSPEQILGLDDVGPPTDIYALASVVFELLTGRVPYEGSNNFEVLYGHRNAAIPDASSVNPRIPKAVGAVVMRGMAKERSKRYRSVLDFATEFEVAAKVKRVDLVAALPFIGKVGATPTADVPIAEQHDVQSVLAKNDSAGDTPDTAVTTLIQLPDMRSLIPATLSVTAIHHGRPIKAQLTVDEQVRGPTPKSLLLAPGRHVVRVIAKGTRGVERVIELVAGSTFKLEVDLP